LPNILYGEEPWQLQELFFHQRNTVWISLVPIRSEDSAGNNVGCVPAASMQARSIDDCRAPSWPNVNGVEERLVVRDMEWGTLVSVGGSWKDYALTFPLHELRLWKEVLRCR